MMNQSKKRRKKKRADMLSGDNMMKTAYILGGTIVLTVLGIVAAAVIYNKDDSATVQAAGGLDYAAAQLDVWEGEDIPPADAFLYDKMRPLVAETQYVVMPANTVGDQNIAILMQLLDGTTRTENAVLSIREPVIRWELGSDTTAQELLGRGYESATLSQPLDEFTEIGSYPVTVLNNGKEKEFTLIVQDTQKPVVTFQDNLSFYVNQKLTVKDFVKSCEDMSPVEYNFSDEPLTVTEGIKDISLIVTDAAGNSITYDLEYLVSGDGQPPEITGVTDMQTIAGIPIDYMRGVSASDASDGDVEVTVTEPEDFNIRMPGTYEIVYSASDQVGNEGEVKAKLTVLPSLDDVSKLNSADVFRMGDYVINNLKKNTDPSDTKAFARAIYNYVQEHMFYSDNKDILDWQHAAVVAMFNGYGDCRNYYAFSRLLLTCADIENMTVEKEKVEEHENAHYWNLVKINGAWYHFDTTPRFDVSDFFMWTDAQMDAYSSWNGGCFNRDKSLYPPTPN